MGGPVCVKFLVVDDHVLIRDALRDMLGALKRDAAVLESSNCRAAMRCLEGHSDVGLVLLDLSLPDGNGLEMLAELRRRYPAVGIVVLSAHHDHETVRRVFDLGALGFIPKSAERVVIATALKLILNGSVYVPPEFLLGNAAPAPSNGAAYSEDSHQPADFGLTSRQIEVLALMMRGCSNKEICRVLDVAEPTVKCHVSAILHALGVSTRLEAVAAANELGWQLGMPRMAT
jgi:DNA-binding NarL/FixJ family response regulator